MLDAIRNGNATALDALLSEEWAGLVRFLDGMLRDVEEAEDAAQEAFVRLWTHRERWLEGTARSVLYRIGRNHALDLLRRRKVRAASPLDAAGAVEGSERPDERFEADALGLRVRAAIESLPEKRREVFELVRFHGMSYAEVAEVLDRSPQTVANHMSLAMADLRTMLAADLPSRGRGDERVNDGNSSREEQSDG